jgi:hypothetical protein
MSEEKLPGEHSPEIWLVWLTKLIKSCASMLVLDLYLYNYVQVISEGCCEVSQGWVWAVDLLGAPAEILVTYTVHLQNLISPRVSEKCFICPLAMMGLDMRIKEDLERNKVGMHFYEPDKKHYRVSFWRKLSSAS